MLLSAINLPFYDPQVTNPQKRVVFLWRVINEKMPITTNLPLQFDKSGYHWAVIHLICTGESEFRRALE